jgi:Flp pilus assembly protein TadD
MSSARQVARKVRSQRRKTRFLLVAGGVLVVLALLTARPLTRRWEKMQSDSHVAAARAAIEKQDFMAALSAVQQAAAADPQNPEMLHTAVDALVGLNAPPDEILSTIQLLEHAGGLTPEMHLQRAESQLMRGDFLAAERTLEALPEAARQSWQAVELEATLLLRQGRTALATERLQATEAADSSQAAFRRAVLSLNLLKGSERAAARQIIWQTALSAGPDQKLALALLSRDADLTAAEADELLRLTNPTDAAGLR